MQLQGHAVLAAWGNKLSVPSPNKWLQTMFDRFGFIITN